MRIRKTASLTVTAALAVGALTAAGPATGAENSAKAKTSTSVMAPSAARGMPTGTVSVAKVKNGGQKVYSANIGVNSRGEQHCKSTSVTMEKVVWDLGKVTRTSARVKSVKVRYYNERKLHVGSAYLHDGSHHEKWRKAWGWQIPKGDVWRTYKINKTVKFAKNKPLNFMLHVQLERANEPMWCAPKVKLYFYLKPNR
ncbi:hypothetical protein GPA10_00840 [Streptomyces sp. p1417]|uniref:Uncharacterized protein n=1 Tax=Streptomyces typhae TaxID=2681492 RepID=A0A6L6WN38_9ACTN|nr:hypothetical protein [Streptomyces typhae]MVO83340.1 hypothetical protein [Streptomyces typhae]